MEDNSNFKYTLKQSSQFKKDLKSVKFDEHKLNEIQKVLDLLNFTLSLQRNDMETLFLKSTLFSRWIQPSEIPATTAGHISCACDIRKKTNFWDKTPCLYLRKLAILSSSRYFNVMLFS